MKRILTCLLSCATLLTACKKEIGENQKLDPKDQRKYDLMTNETGSWWLYGGSDSSISIRKATGRDSTVKDLFFSYYQRVDTTSAMKDTIPEFFGKNKNSYVTLIDIDGKYKQFVTVVFFKDSVDPGATWINTDKYEYSQLKFDVKVESNLIDTGGVMTINNHTYTGVMRVHNDFKGKPTFSSNYTPIGTLEVWFVKGIGIIKQDLNVNIIGQVKKVYRDSLLDYHLVQ